MHKYANGVERPTKRDFETSERTLDDYTNEVGSSDWDSSAMNGEDIEEILHSANTVLNYHKQHLGSSGNQIGTRPKRSREVDSSNSSGSGYTP
jgi:hypothetical protein